MKIMAIVGSPRLKGNTNYLVDQTLAEAAKLGADTEKIVLSEHEVQPCVGHDDCASFELCFHKGESVEILNRFREADGVILATPVYYYNVTAQMKDFIDRNYFFYTHGQKYSARAVGIIITAGEIGIEDTLHTLRHFTDEIGVPEGNIFVVSGYVTWIGDAEKNLPLVEEARDLGRQMVESIK